MIRRVLIIAALCVASAGAGAQSLTPAQQTTVRAFVCADTGTARPMMLAGDAAGVRDWLNAAGTYIVWRRAIPTASIGPVLNYQAVAALTTANRDRATTFVVLNPSTFDATSDIALYWETTFGGALDGQGANTRATLQAHWRRTALRVEEALASGTGTTASPGALTFEGSINDSMGTRLVFNDNGTLRGC